MGLDVVEIVMECEKAFQIEIEDWKLERMSTVGDLFELVCEQLGVPFGADQPRPVSHALAPPTAFSHEDRNRDTVWASLVDIVVDQLQIEREDVKYPARFAADLGAD